MLDNDPTDGILDTAVSIGGSACGEDVTTISQSDTILFGGTTAFAELSDEGDCTPLPLDGGIFPHQLGNLAAQTLALTYNTLFLPDPTSPTFGDQTLAAVGCFTGDAAFLGLSSSSTLAAVLAKANQFINDADNGGASVTRAQVTRMTALLGDCVNDVNGFVWGYSPGEGGGGLPLLALLAVLGGAIPISIVIAPGIKARLWRRPTWW